ncbi:hypothetical protein BC937DRAFT_92574 [Endogone sp. FLAS-F59071]|nr:hypothetical protein BC937DRAFT_92574 [Endogone sp. FLAS-F59071]|eukprot:RUS23080.1 hypothetical protein BC937DRAFT_92574 [Endogone sp. FLAS-F59071]
MQGSGVGNGEHNPSSKRASLASIGASPPKEAITSPTDETVPKKTLVWLDCDPGYHPSIELLGISTVHGNQTLPKTTYNAASFLKASGLRHLKVVPGQAAPLVKFPIVANEIHGDSGTFAFSYPFAIALLYIYYINPHRPIPYGGRRPRRQYAPSEP